MSVKQGIFLSVKERFIKVSSRDTIQFLSWISNCNSINSTWKSASNVNWKCQLKMGAVQVCKQPKVRHAHKLWFSDLKLLLAREVHPYLNISSSVFCGPHLFTVLSPKGWFNESLRNRFHVLDWRLHSLTNGESEDNWRPNLEGLVFTK